MNKASKETPTLDVCKRRAVERQGCNEVLLDIKERDEDSCTNIAHRRMPLQKLVMRAYSCDEPPEVFCSSARGFGDKYGAPESVTGTTFTLLWRNSFVWLISALISSASACNRNTQPQRELYSS